MWQLPVSVGWSLINAAARSLFTPFAKELPAPVISVGNVLAGGVGKTEIVSLLAQELKQKGLTVAVAMRGYNHSGKSFQDVYAQDFSEGVNQGLPDEALIHLHRGIPVFLGANRYQSGMKNWSLLKPDVILLDDGFQHFAIKRDLDVIVHDSTRSFYGNVYRDFPWFVGHSDLNSQLIPRLWCQYVSEHNQSTDSECSFYYEPQNLCVLDALGKRQVLENKFPNGVHIFSGIGSPERFRNSMQKVGYKVLSETFFDDHASYEDVSALLKIRDKVSLGQGLVTTFKDYVKLWKKTLPQQPLDGLSFLHIEPKLVFSNQKVEQEWWRIVHESAGIRFT